MEPVSNAISVITGIVQLLIAIHHSIEAIHDAPQQIRHLLVVCQAAQVKLQKIYQQLKSVEFDEDQRTYYDAIYQVVRSMRVDIILIREQIPKDIPSKGLFARFRNSAAVKALDIALNQNNEAIDRFDRSINVLMWITENLWECEKVSLAVDDRKRMDDLRRLLKDLTTNDMFPIRTAVTPPRSGTSSIADTPQQPDTISNLKREAYKRGKNLAIRKLRSGAQTPATTEPSRRNSYNLAIKTEETLAKEENVTAEEQRLRYTEACFRTDNAENEGFPDVAAFFHSQAMSIRENLASTEEDLPLDFEDRARMEARHVSILLKCFDESQREEGQYRLDNLAKKIDDLASSGELDNSKLFEARKGVGQQYLDLRRFKPAVRYLRDALFQGDLLQNKDSNRSEIEELVKTIRDAYRRDFDPAVSINEGPFIKLVTKRLGYNPLADELDAEAIRTILVDWNFDVNFSSMPHATGLLGDVKDEYGNCMLHKAVSASDNHSINKDIIRRLSMDHSQLNALNGLGLTPLFVAVEARNVEAVRILLDEGADLGMRKSTLDMSETILHSCQDPEIMEILLDRIDWQRRDSAKSFHSIGRMGTAAEATSSAEPLSIDAKAVSSMTPLHRACERANYETAKVLLKRGADVNAKSSNDETPLILACRMRGAPKARIMKVIELLINNQADIGAVTKNGRTARKALKDSRMFSKTEIRALLGPPTSIPRMDTLDTATETSSASSFTPSYRLSLNNVCGDDFIVLDDDVQKSSAL